MQANEFDELLKKVRQTGQDIIAEHANDVDEKARLPHEAFTAIKNLKLMSAYVPESMGGMGLNVHQVAKVCEVLGYYCGSTAMIYAMHKIQVACILHHYNDSPYFKNYLQKLVAEQRLIASATTEVGVGGDLRSSICSVQASGENFNLTKQAPVISYGEEADDLMITARRNEDAAKSDQVHVMLSKEQYELEPISDWDTLGFRGTVSSGFIVTASANKEQILATPFADILSQTMHPYAHIVWSSLWCGIAGDAVNMARKFVKNQAKKKMDSPPIAAIRLGEVDSSLQLMRNNIESAVNEYQKLLAAGDLNAFTNFGFSIRINNLKMTSSQMVVDIVGQAMLICGISSYRNDSPMSLGRHIRDAYGAALMVNNDRIMWHNSTLLLMHKEES